MGPDWYDGRAVGSCSNCMRVLELEAASHHRKKSFFCPREVGLFPQALSSATGQNYIHQVPLNITRLLQDIQSLLRTWHLLCPSTQETLCMLIQTYLLFETWPLCMAWLTTTL